MARLTHAFVRSRRAMTLALLAALMIVFAENCVTAEKDAAGASTPTAAAAAADNSSAASSLSGAFAEPKVWLVSFISILIISFVGLLSVAVVPLVQRTYYNHFIQYLVALAVGSLTGDAMLHLLPHAIVKSAMEDAHAARCHDEKQTVFKGLVALGGVYFFFMAEKIVALVTEYRTEQKAIQEHEQHRLEDGGGDEVKEKNKLPSRRLSKLYGAKSCDDIMTTGLSSKALRSIDNYKNQECSDSEAENDCHAAASNEETALKHLELPGGQQQQKQELSVLDESASASASAASKEEIKLVVPEDRTAQGQGQGHGHGHGHGHSHEMPQSLASVAWMVIFGDGLHNFTDGLAIGAAFAQSITGGVSTSIAVFCHELPHELGDFAVLLKTGMQVRQALMYNILSSVLAAVGMVIGICLGNVTSASYWIFAITAGTFIYISLVDMLPELNLINVKPGESRIAHFMLQNAGICTGVGVMFLIAMFEGEIKGMLGDTGHDDHAVSGSC